MDEDEFWGVVGLAGGSAQSHHLHRIWLALVERPPEEILGFQDRLAEVLFRLDLRPIATQRWRDVSEPWWVPRVPGVSADGFLYARCDAVLHGRAEVERILGSHKAFKRSWDTSAEELLSIAPQAWESVTKRPFDHSREQPFSYETGSNPAGGWPTYDVLPGQAR